jgi:cytochrome c oxidase subunit 2
MERDQSQLSRTRPGQWSRLRLGREVWRRVGRWGLPASALFLMGCEGAQSALMPGGREAEQIARLFWGMTAGAAVIWLGVAVLGIYAIRVEPDPAKTRRRARLLIVLGGAVVPTVILAALLTYGLWMLPPLVAMAPEGSLRIAVAGERWWWRVQYLNGDGEGIKTANEIRLPVGEPVQFELASSNVIHSFWIPSLGGKRDMIPGRTTYLALTPTRTGVYRGACAEYCGTSHALMNFYVEVMEKEAFSRWLKEEAAPAQDPDTDLARRGRDVFLALGCGACHAVRGTAANGVIGPDLTHVGRRFSLGAGITTNDPTSFEQWISFPEKIKPGVHMPGFRMLPEGDRRAMAAYLEGLK